MHINTMGHQMIAVKAEAALDGEGDSKTLLYITKFINTKGRPNLSQESLMSHQNLRRTTEVVLGSPKRTSLNYFLVDAYSYLYQARLINLVLPLVI